MGRLKIEDGDYSHVEACRYDRTFFLSCGKGLKISLLVFKCKISSRDVKDKKKQKENYISCKIHLIIYILISNMKYKNSMLTYTVSL